MKSIALTSALLAVVTGGSVLAYGITRPSAERPDCPGTVVCPITGELVCRDECPLAKTAGATDATPACCRATP